MRIGGQWVGWGPGDTDPKVTEFKGKLKRKFSYAKELDDAPLYDQALFDVVYKAQTVYHGQGKLHPANGIIDFDTQVALGWIKRTPPALPTLFTVCGTGVPWWVGPDADVARAVLDKYTWQPIGYPAAPFPMGNSVEAGRAELINQINLRPGKFSLIGYSQGAIVTSELWEYDIKPTTGVLHHRLSDVVKAVTFGNPMAEAGAVWPDPGAAPVGAKATGIADQLMEDTPQWWRNYRHKKDLYTDCEGRSGESKRAIYKIVMGKRMFSGPDSLLSEVLELTQEPLFETIGVFRAIMDAGMFAARGTGPHVNYHIAPAIDYLRS